LQWPDFHLPLGSGLAVQYQPLSYLRVRSQPSQLEITSWQQPPEKVQPVAPMNTHSSPLRIVVQIIMKLLSLNCPRVGL
jgi:hypothetical protein